MSKSKNDFQIIGISETRLKKTQETTTIIQSENYNIEYIPTESANQGFFQAFIATTSFSFELSFYAKTK